MRLALGLAVALMAVPAMGQFYGYKDAPAPGQARVATDAAGVGVRVDQRLNEFIPLDAKFKDEQGKDVLLGKYFTNKPVVVLPIFYRCPGVCENELFNLISSLRGFKRDFIGREFTVVVIDIDPTEKPPLATQKKDTAVAAYMQSNTDREKRVMAEKGWHFLTGDLDQILRVTDALGFKFKFDKANGTITHPAGIMVLTPAGKISRYFVTTEYPQQVLLNSIRDAGKELVGVKDDRPFFLACIQTDPLTGAQTINILNTLKTMGVLTILAILVSIFVWNRKYKTTHGGGE